MTDPQNFIDRLLEVENLTGNLEDEDADFLINWGVAQLREGLGKIEDIPTAGEYTNDLMGFMRTLNQIAGNLGNVTQEDLLQLVERHQKALGMGRDMTPDDYAEPASRLSTMTPRQAIEYLLQWLQPEENQSPEDRSPSNDIPSSRGDSTIE